MSGDRAFRSYLCLSCRSTMTGDVESTLAVGIVLGYCTSCKKRTPSRDLGAATPATSPIRAPERDVEELLGPGDRFTIGDPGERFTIDRATALSALESGEDGGTIAPYDREAAIVDAATRFATATGGSVEEARRTIEAAMRGGDELEETIRRTAAIFEDPEAGERAASAIRELAASTPDHVQAAYLEWRRTQDGMAVVEAIRRRAVELSRRGWRRYGIQALAEVVRFDRALSIGPDAAGYRVNNSHLSRLARDLMDEDPDLGGFFEVRELRSDGARGDGLDG